MKIAFLSFYSGEVYRGVETFVHELANRLTLFGHDVTVYQNGPEVEGARYKTVTIGIKNKSIKGLSSLGVLLNGILDVFVVARFTSKVLSRMDKETDFVVSTNQRLQVYLCKFWTIRNKAKLVAHGQGGPGFDERLALWSFPDAYIPLSKFQADWDRQANPFVKIADVIPNGVDLSQFKKEGAKIDFGLPKPIILCVAALWPNMKRQQLLIKAVSRLEKGSLLLVGSGEGEEMLSKLGTKLLRDRFKIVSYPHSKMKEVYRSCDLFSYPTVAWESFGIVLVEAMASGLGVVASDDPIRREIVGGAGVFVDPTDTDAYTRALKVALETKWGNKPRKQAQKFDWDEIAKKYEKLFVHIALK